MRALPAPPRRRPINRKSGGRDYGKSQAEVAGSLPALQAVARVHPRLVAEEVGTLSELAWETLAHAIFPGDGMVHRRRGVSVRAAVFEAEHAGDTPQPGEALHLEVIAFSWAEHWAIGLLCAANPGSIGLARRLEASNRRLMAAIKTLSQITAAERPTRRIILEQVG